MMERLTEVLPFLFVAEKPSGQGNGLGRLIESYFQRVSEGEQPEKVIKDIWVGHFRGDTTGDQTIFIVAGLFGRLPEEVQQKLEEPIHRPGSEASLIILAREAAKREVEGERRKAMAEKPKMLVEKQPEERKKPSRGMAKHIRRVKSVKRRSGSVFPKP